MDADGPLDASADAVRRDQPALPSAAATLIAAGCRVALGIASRSRLQLDAVNELVAGTRAARELDELARQASEQIPCLRDRSSAYLRWRWLAQLERAWTLTTARDRGGRLRGFVVFGPHASTGRVSDLLALDEAAQRVLVAHAVRTLAASGFARVSLELLDPRPWSARAIRATGGIPRGSGPEYLIVHTTDQLRSLVTDRGSWYVTIGDSDHV